VSIRIVAPDEVETSFERADEVIFEEEEDDGHTTRTHPKVISKFQHVLSLIVLLFKR
jgi:hypothetical protein